jgi:hypothetical protein
MIEYLGRQQRGQGLIDVREAAEGLAELAVPDAVIAQQIVGADPAAP